MAAFATIEDMETIWRELTEDEEERAEALLELVSDMLRWEAQKVGKDLDSAAAENSYLASAVKSVTVDIVARTLTATTGSTSSEQLTQFTQSALGYSYSGTYLNPGGGIYIKKSELERLGLRRQQFRSIDMRGVPYGD